MKLSTKWGGRIRNKKAFKPEPKLPWQLLGLADPGKQKTAMPIDEVRRQVLMMSSSGFVPNSPGPKTTTKTHSRVENSATRIDKSRHEASR